MVFCSLCNVLVQEKEGRSCDECFARGGQVPYLHPRCGYGADGERYSGGTVFLCLACAKARGKDRNEEGQGLAQEEQQFEVQEHVPPGDAAAAPGQQQDEDADQGHTGEQAAEPHGVLAAALVAGPHLQSKLHA